jgi:hypothetical protein
MPTYEVSINSPLVSITIEAADVAEAVFEAVEAAEEAARDLTNYSAVEVHDERT